MTNTSVGPARLDSALDNGWRGPLLNATLWVAALLGSLWFCISLVDRSNTPLSLTGMVAEGLLTLVWIAALFKRLPEAIRLAFLLSLFFGVAAVTAIDIGPVRPAVPFLLMLLLLMAMLYGGLRGALAAGASIAILYAIGAYGWVTGIFPFHPIDANADPHRLSIWIRSAAGQLMASATIAAIVFYVMQHERQIAAALRVSEDRARLLLEHAPEAILVLDMESQRFVVANPAAESLFGYSQAELRTKSPIDLSPELQPDGRSSRDAAAAYAAAADQGAKSTFEWLHRSADGRDFLSEVRLLRLPDPNRVLMRSSVVDITERNALQERLRHSQKLEAIGTLAGGIAHDFNNILAGVLGFAELARQVTDDNSEVRQYLDHISDAGRRAANLVTQILAFSRAGGLARTPIQMREVVTEAMKLLRVTMPASIAIDIQLAENLPMVLANGSQLHQILMNLGINAAQAIGDKAGTLSVSLAACEVDGLQASTLSDIGPGTYVCLRVADTGCGMDAATLQRAFEPFYTTKAQGQGTGLGLSIIHGIVHSHHGAIRLSSELRVGTTVEIFLPATAIEPRAEVESAESVRPGHGERILLLDDVESLVMMGEIILRQLGYVVETESDALQALTRIEQDPHYFQLVVTDQTMPRLSGLDFAARVRAIRPDLPIVLTSGLSMALSPERIQASGVREILAKPYTGDELAAAVRRQLQH